MSAGMYGFVGLIVCAAVLLASLWAAIKAAPDATDLLLLVVASVIGAITAGFIWPATLAVVAIYGVALHVRRRLDAAEQAPSPGKGEP